MTQSCHLDPSTVDSPEATFQNIFTFNIISATMFESWVNQKHKACHIDFFLLGLIVAHNKMSKCLDV